ncbi:MAG: hypothetical protein M1820_009362 [Bogoriella megaspora]|nr:MAG: hypothetical protein M1820_009362 [Bogoriella megaspora]
MSRSGKSGSDNNRALFVKNLSFNVTREDLFELFGKFGPVRYVLVPFPAFFAFLDALTNRSQIRQGIANNTKGTCFVVYEDAVDAKTAFDKLSGYNFQGRYLIVLFHQPDKMAKSQDLAQRREELEQLKKQHNIE